MVFQIWCHSLKQNVPLWLPIILILLSNDIHLNPGPHFQNNLFNFMSWNLNSLAKDNFQRTRLIEAHNALFNNDLISICETSLNDSVELHETLINDYTFVSANNPANVRHGGVGLFFENSLPVEVRNDLSFDESIVIELKYFLLFYIEVLLLSILRVNFKPSCQLLKNYIPKSKVETPLQHFLLVILMHTLSFDGLMAIQILRVWKLKISLLHWVYLKLFPNQLILNLIRTPNVLILSQLTNLTLF